MTSYPKISYHGGHSAEFCDHAKEGSTTLGNIEKYIEEGFKHFAITEHTPPPSDKFLYDDEIALSHDAKYLQERFERYFGEIRAQIKERYSDKADILFGFETEYYGEDPDEQVLNLVTKYQPDIVVASLHHVNDVPIDFSEEEYKRAVKVAGGLEQLYLDYFSSQLKLIKVLRENFPDLPIIVGHVDLIRIFSKDFSFTTS